MLTFVPGLIAIKNCVTVGPWIHPATSPPYEKSLNVWLINSAWAFAHSSLCDDLIGSLFTKDNGGKLNFLRVVGFSIGFGFSSSTTSSSIYSSVLYSIFGATGFLTTGCSLGVSSIAGSTTCTLRSETVPVSNISRYCSVSYTPYSL